MPDSDKNLRARRTEPATYVARNSRGAEVRVGLPGATNSFTPGELLQLALATCAAVSADHVLSSRLGPDFSAEIRVTADEDTSQERYTQFDASIDADMSALDDDRHAALIDRAQKAVERLCTVGRTLSNSAEYSVQLRSR
jgi:uncharacterized OsmC-like protein